MEGVICSCSRGGTSSVIKVNVSTAPSISFPTSTAINTADATDNPQKVTLANVGNENLSIPIPWSGKNPSVTGAFSLNADGRSQDDCGQYRQCRNNSP